MSDPRALTRRSLLTGAAAPSPEEASGSGSAPAASMAAFPGPSVSASASTKNSPKIIRNPRAWPERSPPDAAEPARPQRRHRPRRPSRSRLAPSFRRSGARLADIQALPKIVITSELKCIEGWTRISQWAGARFSDFVARFYHDDIAPDQYVGMETPDGEYYVGLDLASAMHPQTLLAYELNGQPLPAEHGAPLRLLVPIKYGIKNLKRIGKIDFSQSRPKDYWAEQGYDWYAGF